MSLDSEDGLRESLVGEYVEISVVHRYLQLLIRSWTDDRCVYIEYQQELCIKFRKGLDLVVVQGSIKIIFYVTGTLTTIYTGGRAHLTSSFPTN